MGGILYLLTYSRELRFLEWGGGLKICVGGGGGGEVKIFFGKGQIQIVSGRVEIFWKGVRLISSSD